jgi:hypothetical protein
MISFLARRQVGPMSALSRTASGVISSTRPRFAAQSCTSGGMSQAATAILSTRV